MGRGSETCATPGNLALPHPGEPRFADTPGRRFLGMSTTRVIASAAAVVSAVLAVAGCGDNGQSAAVAAPAGASTMSVVIGTDGDPSAPSSVQYTCPGSGSGSVCGPEIVHGRWSKTLDVPVGTEIWIHATNAKDPSNNGSPPKIGRASCRERV